MGFDAANQISHNKFNLPIKIFGDTSNSMNPASVPRKLRSAMKKRSCKRLSSLKGVSPLVNCVQPLRNDCSKKLKPNTNNFSDHSLSKEEEEVAETLSALAGSIPPSTIHMNKSKKENPLISEPKGSVLPNKEANVGSHPVSYETNVTSVPTDPENLSRSKSSELRHLNLNLQVSFPSENLIIPSILGNCGMKQEQALLSTNEPHTRLGVTNHENIGLTSSAPHGLGVGLSLKPFAVMFPSWLNTTATSSSGFGAREVDYVSTDKVSCSTNRSMKSWKKCVTHVYITRLIQSLQTSEGKDAPPSDASHLRPSHCVTGTLNLPDNSYAVNHIPHHEQERPSFSGCCASNKQSGYDFLSLSSGAVSAADNTEIKSFERGVKGQMDFPCCVGQNGALVSFSLLQNQLPYNSYQDQVGVISAGSQVHLPISPYYSNPYGTSHMSTTTTKATTTLTAPFRPGSFLSSHITNSQNRRLNLQSDTTHHLHVSQQPLPLVGLGSSLPHLRAKSQHNQLPLHL